MLTEVFKDFLQQYNGGKGEAEGAGSALEAFKRYEKEHPDMDLAKTLDLPSDPTYKTDPAQMKLEGELG